MTSGESGLAEVAEDFQGSLEFLTNNDRFAINNFTIIARENTEDAQDICDVLIEHIGKVSNGTAPLSITIVGIS